MPAQKRAIITGTTLGPIGVDPGTTNRQVTPVPGILDASRSIEQLLAMLNIQFNPYHTEPNQGDSDSNNGAGLVDVMMNFYHRLYSQVVVTIAKYYLSVRELRNKAGKPINRGDEIDEFLETVDTKPGVPWCAAFVYYCHSRAAGWLPGRTTCPKTAGAVDMWALGQRNNYCFKKDKVVAQKERLRSGDIFVTTRPDNHEYLDINQSNKPIDGNMYHISGHTGLVLSHVQGSDQYQTIEGNTNTDGSREGDGVYRRTRYISRSTWLYGFVRPRLVFDPW